MAINHGTLNNCNEKSEIYSYIYSYHDIVCSSLQMRERDKYEKDKKVIYITHISPAICIMISIKFTYIKMLLNGWLELGP